MKERKCRKCGNSFAWVAIINGKKRNLQRRKFCLDCSPYGGHNTKTDDPLGPTKRHSEYKTWSEERKLLHRARVYRRGIERKTKLIEMSGGKCSICGYSKCQRAMTFHHRDPQLKIFCLSLNELWSRSWETILEEWNKCDLLCIRCHIELEDSLALVTPESYRAIIAQMT